MQYIKTFENYTTSFFESLKTMLTAMSKMGSGIQQELAKAKLAAVKPCGCVKLAAAIGEDNAKTLLSRVSIKQKECYANALHVAERCSELGVEYCEGWIFYHGIPIDHAFNKIGDIYFDVTAEFALKDNPEMREYAVLGSWDPTTALMIMATGPYKCYGDVFNKEFFETHQENVK